MQVEMGFLAQGEYLECFCMGVPQERHHGEPLWYYHVSGWANRIERRR